MGGRIAVVGAVLCLLAGPVAFADDPPDSELNPVTDYTESVDVGVGSSHRVRHTEDRGQLGRVVTLVSTDPGANPRLAIKQDGNSWVVWWNDGTTDAVYCIVRDVTDGSWSEEAVLSDPGEDSRYPEIAHSGTETWVAYEIQEGSETSVAVNAITDDLDPFGERIVVATTDYGGEVDVLMHTEDGHVWVTWVDGTTDVGWSEYDHTEETWSSVQLESYSGISVSAARAEIRAAVLGN